MVLESVKTTGKYFCLCLQFLKKWNRYELQNNSTDIFNNSQMCNVNMMNDFKPVKKILTKSTKTSYI